MGNKTKFYNLDIIISVGYRIKSIVGIHFRQCANKVLKDYMLIADLVKSAIGSAEPERKS